MKRLLVILFAFLTITLCGQQPIQVVPVYYSSGGYYSEYQTVYTAFGTKPESTYADYQEAMVYSLDTCDFEGGASVWDRMDAFYVFAAHEADNESLINWASPGTCDADNPTETAWTQWQGYIGNGTDDWLSTNFNPSTNGSNYTRNSASIGVYTRTNTDNNYQLVSCNDGTSAVYLRPSQSDTYSARINASSSMGGSNGNSQGFYILVRPNATNNILYRNGSVVEDELDNSNGVPNDEIDLFRTQDASGYQVNEISIFFVCNALTADEVIAVNTIIETYMDALGKGIQ